MTVFPGITFLAAEREYRARDGRPLAIEEARTRFSSLGPWADGAIQELLDDDETWSTPVGSQDPTGDFSAALAPQAPLPASVGGFNVIRLLGRGGMGVVYLADDPLGRRQVAVKVMKAEYAADSTSRERFLREARSAMAVEHDNVVPVYQVNLDGNIPFLVMPVLRGESLQDRLTREPLPPLELVLKVGREVALGLAAAHEKGLVHRDAKPANTWLEGDPASADESVRVRRVKVLDFGLARATDGNDGVSVTGSIVGTPAFLAPEQAAGRAVDARADLFSLGAILYQMATGRTAFSGPSQTAILTAVASFTPPPPHTINPVVPPTLSDLIMRLLEKEAGKRPESAHAVADTSSTGRRLRVYFEAVPALCCRQRRTTSLAIPV